METESRPTRVAPRRRSPQVTALTIGIAPSPAGRGADNVRLPEGRAPEHAGVGPPVGSGQIGSGRPPSADRRVADQQDGTDYGKRWSAVVNPEHRDSPRRRCTHASRLGHATI